MVCILTRLKSFLLSHVLWCRGNKKVEDRYAPEENTKVMILRYFHPNIERPQVEIFDIQVPSVSTYSSRLIIFSKNKRSFCLWLPDRSFKPPTYTVGPRTEQDDSHPSLFTPKSSGDYLLLGSDSVKGGWNRSTC